ncbi:MAG: PHP domain-containing protein [Herpetosiphon sp.]
MDLHLHTIATPHHATWEPGALVQAAIKQGISTIAVTDHNTTVQVQAALDAARGTTVRVVPGLELDSAAGDKLWHILIYGVDPDAPEIVALGRSVGERNARDAQEMAAVLAARGIDVPWFHALERRPTVADLGSALVRDGVVESQPGVEDEAVGTGWIMQHLRGLYRPVTVDEAVAAAHANGGIAVLAHPGRSKGQYAIPATEADVGAMVGMGLDGIEALYAGHSAEDQRFYGELAERFGLLVSAGSDSHHPADGLRPQPEVRCAALLERLGCHWT